MMPVISLQRYVTSSSSPLATTKEGGKAYYADHIAKFTIWQTAARRLAGWIAEPSKCGLRWQKWCAYAVASETEISIA